MNLKLMMALGLTSVTIAACGGDDKEGESITHATARQAITSNTTEISTRVSASIRFLEQSDLLLRGLEFAPSECYAEGSGADFDSGECVSEPFELDTDLSEPTSELTRILEEQVFAEGNIESSSGTSVTYLLRGDIVCGADEDSADCAAQVDDAQIRLVVTSPSPGDIDVAVQVGPQKANPVSFEFHQTSLAAEIDLGGIKSAVSHLQDGAAEGLPQTLEGRIRGEIRSNGAANVTATLSVLQAINVVSDEITVSLAASNPTLQVTADGTAKTIDALADLGTLRVKGPFFGGDGYWDEELQDWIEEEPSEMDLSLAGASAQTTFSASTETLTFTNLGLGDATTTVKVDGQTILTIDLNKDDGRRFGATITETNGGAEIEVSPKFDLVAGLNFGNLSSGDYDEWMLNDTLRILLDGTSPKIRMQDGEMEVLSGSVTLSLQNAGESITATAGQCISVESDDDILLPEPGEDPLPEPVSSNPIADMTVGTCG